MTGDEFKKMVDNNTWHSSNQLQPTLDALAQRFMPDPNNPWTSKFGWSWAKNPGWRAKYVTIKIDMRDGGFVLLDKNGERISIEQIQAQRTSDAKD